MLSPSRRRAAPSQAPLSRAARPAGIRRSAARKWGRSGREMWLNNRVPPKWRKMKLFNSVY